MSVNLPTSKAMACIGAVLALTISSPSSASTAGTRSAAVTFEGAYTGEVLSVASGGLARGAVFRGLAEAAAEIDLATCTRAPAGTRFRLSALAPHGGDFSGTRLGDLQGASNIAAYNHPSLYELWLGRQGAEERFEWRTGRLVADADFATTESGSVLLNSSFGWPAFISANTRNTGPAFNRSALGAFASARLAAGVRVRAGVYDGDSFDDLEGDPARHPNGLHFEIGHGQGIFAIAEVAFDFPARAAAADRPGGLKLGAWRHTAEFADQADPGKAHSGNHGFYAVVEQTLWREPETGTAPPRSLTVFARLGVSPDERSRLSRTADAGFVWTGLLPGRESDTLGLGVAWVRIGNEARRAERAAGAAVVSDRELVVEATYELALGERCHLIPDLQWVHHPGGSGALPDAVVLGLRTRIRL